MTFEPGSHIGPYEILSRVGAGGMGEVFRARDTRLGRTVALKALPAEFAQSAQLRLRLQREARTISALAHPHICTLYDVGEENGVEYLVMEFLEGETLRERIMRGSLPLDDALRFAIEIAGALETAHQAGIVHRDLKPDNIVITKSGAKLLDFGLARGMEAEKLAPDAKTLLTNEPLTTRGMIAGTIQYMAPELFGGATADTRSDIFAFGAVLHEMLTGRPAFAGTTRPSLIASIVAGAPERVSVLRPMVPAELDHVVQRCLDKEPEGRWQSAHDVRLELQWIAGGAAGAPRVESGRPKRLLPWIAAAVMTAIAIAATFVALRQPRVSPAPGISAHLFAPPGRQLANTLSSLSISPDAKYVTFSVADDDRLWVRDVAANTSRPVEGTEHAAFPFWSPDSRSIAFFADQKLKKVSLDGASPVTLCDAEPGRSGSWNRDGVILFSPTSLTEIHRVADTGGPSVPLTELDKSRETTHRWATFLPDGNHFLYLAANYKDLPANDRSSIYVSSLDAPKQRTLLVRARSNVAYANGHLLYSDKGELFAQRFDPRTLKLAGEPFRIAANVETDREYFRVAFAVSDSGTLVYRAGLASDATRLVWLDERGGRAEVMRPNLDIIEMQLSPDQRRAVARVVDWRTGARDLYLLDLVRRMPIRLTFEQSAFYWSPLWSPDGTRLMYSRGVPPDIDLEIVMRNVDGDGTDEVLVRGGKVASYPKSWSPDGSHVLYDRQDSLTDPDTKDIWMIEPRAGATPSLFLGGRGAQSAPAFSPDGKWVVYTSDESGRDEIYAVRFPGRTAKTQISLTGATSAQWAGNDALIVRSLKSVARVPVTFEGNTLRAGTPVPIEEPEGAIVGDSRDGKRSLYLVADNHALRHSIAIVSEWRRPER